MKALSLCCCCCCCSNPRFHLVVKRFTVGRKRQCGLLDVWKSALQQQFQVCTMIKKYTTEQRKPFRGDTKKEKCSAMRSENSCRIWPAAGLREMGSRGKGTSTETLLSHMRVLQIALCLSVSPPPPTHTHT